MVLQDGRVIDSLGYYQEVVQVSTRNRVTAPALAVFELASIEKFDRLQILPDLLRDGRARTIQNPQFTGTYGIDV